MNQEQIKNAIRKDIATILIRVVAFLVYYILLILIGVALFIGAAWATISIGKSFPSWDFGSIIWFIYINILIWLPCISIGVFLIRPLFKFPKASTKNELEISENDAPKLFDMIKEVSKATGNKMPKHVYLTAGVNAYVSYDSVSVWSIFFPARKNLAIGIGLLEGLNESELKAILSHEFGHFSQQSMRIGTITYRLMLIIGNMIKYDQQRLTKKAGERLAPNYKWYFHLNEYFSFITRMTVAFYRFIEKKNRHLSRHMEFEADLVACRIVDNKSYISALCKLETMSRRFALYEQMIANLMQENHFINNFFAGYLYVYNQLSDNESLGISSHDILDGPVGDTSLFPSRISVIDGWDTHPSLQERIDNINLFQNESKTPYTDNVRTLVDQSVLISFGRMHQRYIAANMQLPIKWESLKSFNDEEFTQWAIKKVEHWPSLFISPFLSQPVESFPFPKDEDVENENVEFPFTPENRNLIIKHSQAITDWRILDQIRLRVLDVKRFIYNGETYTDVITPMTIQDQYLNPIHTQRKALDLQIYKYLWKKAEDKMHLITTYWMIMYANDNLKSMTPIYNAAYELWRDLSFYNSYVEGPLLINDNVKLRLLNDIWQYLRALNYDTINTVCGEWIFFRNITVSQILVQWKAIAMQETLPNLYDAHLLNLIRDVWNFLQMMLNIAYNEWQRQIISVYTEISGLPGTYVFVPMVTEQGQLDKQYNLGVCYENGHGIQRDNAEALKWYTKLAEQGDTKEEEQEIENVRFENECNLTEICIPQNIDEAVTWDTIAAKRGNADAQYGLGLAYYNGTGMEQNYAEAIKWWKKAAKQGQADAQYKLGLAYYYGNGVEQSYKEAIKWWQKAGKQGQADAQTELGLAYYNGVGVKQSYREAVKWWWQAANQGNADAQYCLGCCYDNGQGVPPNHNEAIKWFTKAVAQGHATMQEDAEVQYQLGLCYFDGRDVPKNYEEAFKWWQKAAEQGNADALCAMGYCYITGSGVALDIAEAINWFRKAAEQGNAHAQYNLGLVYSRGEGVEQDEAEAIKWWQMAAEQGNAGAKEALKKIKK